MVSSKPRSNTPGAAPHPGAPNGPEEDGVVFFEGAKVVVGEEFAGCEVAAGA